MDFPWSAVGGLVGSLAATGANLYMNERSNRANIEQAKLQNQWNIEQWNRENAYNAPVQQVARLRSAGINPGLAYANGQMMNEAAPSPEMTSAAGQLRASYVDPMLMANIGLVEAQTEKTKTESDVMAQKLPEELQQLRDQHEQSQELIKKVQVECSRLKEEIELMKSQGRLNDAKAADIVWQQGQRSAEFQQHCKEWETTREKMLAEIDRMKKQNEADDQLIKLQKSIEMLNKQEFEYNVLANVERLLGLKLENSNKSADFLLKLDTHKMYGQQIILNGMDINGRLVEDAVNRRDFSEFSGQKGRYNQITSKLSHYFLRGVSDVTGSINIRLFR